MVDSSVEQLSWNRAIVRYGKWYYVSTFFMKGSSILLLPVYSHYLKPADFGVLTTLTSLAAFFPALITLSLDSAFSRFFHEYKNDLLKLQTLFSTIYWFVFFWGIFVTCIILLWAFLLVENSFTVPFFPHALLAFLPIVFTQLGLLGSTFLKQNLETRKNTFIQCGTVAIGMLCSIFFLVILKYGVISQLLGQAIASIAVFIFYSWWFYKRELLRFKFDLRVFRESFVYSFPLLFLLLSGWIGRFTDRLFINNHQGLSAAGVYGIGVAIAQLLYYLQDAITQVQGTLSISGLLSNKRQTLRMMRESNLTVWGVMLIAYLGLALFSREAIMFFTSVDYMGAYWIIMITAAGYVFGSQYRVFDSILSFRKKMLITSFGGILLAIASIVGNIFLIPLWGGIGASISFSLSVLFYATWSFFWARKFEPIDLLWGKMLYILLVVSILGVLGASLSGLPGFFGKILIFLLSALMVHCILLGRWYFLKPKGDKHR